jgi:hypothetical protein
MGVVLIAYLIVSRSSSSFGDIHGMECDWIGCDYFTDIATCCYGWSHHGEADADHVVVVDAVEFLIRSDLACSRLQIRP